MGIRIFIFGVIIEILLFEFILFFFLSLSISEDYFLSIDDFVFFVVREYFF